MNSSEEHSSPLQSVPTRGRTLDYAAPVYDFLEPLCLFGRQARILTDLLDALSPLPHHKLLDVGCGTGALTAQVAEKLDPAQGGYIVGIDAAARMIAAAREKRAFPGCRFEVAAAENLPFDDATFDAAFSTMFFHHVPADLKLAALREIYRTLIPGGVLCIVDMHKPTTVLGALISHFSRWLLMQPQIAENIHGILPDLIREAGFDEVKLCHRYLGYIACFIARKPPCS
ncbi:MAG: methyltransferase domain-containing protein [Lentisphaerae bacterium]|nr:MAG: methyltransferase domain-containing protein [Lentisphaerota bacterium]